VALDTLRDPKLFRQHKTLVIDRPVFQETTCASGDVDIFPRDRPNTTGADPREESEHGRRT
jgi:hypothetical protein